jgi:hypothetical protein
MINSRHLFRALRFNSLSVVAIISLSGCLEEKTEQAKRPSKFSSVPAAETAGSEDGVISNALDALKNGASKVTEAVEPYASPMKDTAVDSMQKIVAIDYKIIEVDSDESVKALEARLTALGLERWDCSPMPSNEFVTRFICKRFPLNLYVKALSLLPKLAVD